MQAVKAQNYAHSLNILIEITETTYLLVIEKKK